MDLIKIEEVEGELKIDSRLIADSLGIEHRATMQMISAYSDDLEEYGRVTFQMLPLKTNGGTQNIKVAFLNEQQSTFLVTLSKNTKRAVSVKKKLNDSYYYYRNKSLSEAPKLPTTYKEALLELLVKVEENEKLELELQEAQPKIEFHDSVTESETDYSMNETAKILHTGRTRLFKYLRDENIFFGKLPYQKYQDCGYFKVRIVNNDTYSGPVAVSTSKGIPWLSKKMNNQLTF